MSRRRRHAVTLVELLLVLAILGVLGVLVAPAITRRPPAHTSESAQSIARARAQAIATGHGVNLVLTDSAGAYDVVALPSGRVMSERPAGSP